MNEKSIQEKWSREILKNKTFLSKLLIDPFFRNAVVILIPFYVISTVFPLISAGPRISAASLGIHIEISASL